MVVGLDKFKEFFREFNDKFVVIGGAACDVILEDSEIEPRATDDIDMILIVDKMTPEFGRRFWQFIAEGNYQTRARKRGEGKEPVPELFRFIKPSPGYPVRIELLSTRPDILGEPTGFHLTPIPAGEDISSLSAIIMDPDCYEFTIANNIVEDGLRVANPVSLICLKVRAFLNLTEEKKTNPNVRSKDIKAAIAEFERRLNLPGLTNAIPEEASNELRKSYDIISSDFYSKIKPLALETIQQPQKIHDFLNAVPKFVSVIDTFVFDLEQDLESKSNFIHAGLIAFMLLAFVLFFGVRYFLRHTLFEPLEDLANLASSVRNGDFSKSSSYKKHNEIGTLSESMNFMIRDLSRMYSSLEEQVREKTADLNRQNKALNLLYGLKNVLSAELNRSVLEKALDFCSENLEALSCAVYLRNDGDKTLRLAARFSQHPIDPEEIRKFFEGQNISFEKYNFFKREVLGKDCTLVLVPGAVGTTRLSFAAIFCGEAPVHIDRELLRSIAREFALAINNSEKNVESRRLILFEERSTIARELHDSIAQSLSFSRIQITRLDAALKNKSDEAEVRSILDELKLGVITAYQQLRSVLTTFRLKPKSPDLRENILSSLDEFKERSGIDYTVDNQIQSFELDAQSHVHLLHILREALTNVEKHSRATAVEVSFKPMGEGTFEMRVSDNGQGFDLKSKKGHYGLEIMHERAKVLGGELHVEPVIPHGTSVVLRFNSLKKTVA